MQIYLSQNVRYLLKKEKLNAHQFALKIGIPLSTSYDITYKDHCPRVTTVLTIAKYFNLTLEEIFFTNLANTSEIAKSE
jgi:DNA-binding XRE family transcriptional regulator